ncbi:unnamed protein product [Heligmosomoides polygyrus]|uniref:RibD_C domain-containing protein n=1 Tax=Heligmosomoides polygyrus TaxID=6339 RepID=A0A183G8A2_HELPZ|nr:unnamed protein product [Heligmosomoides polygyrus]
MMTGYPLEEAVRFSANKNRRKCSEKAIQAAAAARPAAGVFAEQKLERGNAKFREIVRLSSGQCDFVAGCGTIDAIHAVLTSRLHVVFIGQLDPPRWLIRPRKMLGCRGLTSDQKSVMQ